MKLLVSACVVAGALASGAKTKVLVTEDATHGIEPIPMTLNEWTTAVLHCRVPGKPEDRVVTGEDFFLKEFGHRLAPFGFTNGYRSPVWGRDKDHPDEPAIRFGRGWGSSQGGQWGAKIDLTQAADETDWSISVGRVAKFKVRAPKGRRTTVLVPAGVVRGLASRLALSFACHTTNVAVQVHSFEIVPFVERLHWRGTFVLGFEPWRAGISFQRRNNYELRVNGHLLSTGPGVDNPELLREDVTRFFKSGTNVIDVVTRRVDGYCNPDELVVEAFALSATGERALLRSGPNWKVRTETGKWTDVSTTLNPACRVGGDWSPGKVACFTGVNPMHPGPLQIRHLGPEYPVFDCDAAEIAYEVATPPAMKGTEVELVVSNSLTGAVVERFSVPGAPSPRKVCLKTRATGPYRLYWTLLRDGQSVDRTSRECIIAGPIEQTECAYGDYEKVLAGRMKLVQTRDCVKEETDSALFAEHGAIYSDYTRADIKSKVRWEDGIGFREAGARAGDWFGYKMDVSHPGIPHILEVDYPDTHEQVLYIQICENLPANFCNHGPGCANRLCNATGAVRTGWMAPLTHGKKTLRILFFPASKNVAVAFENYQRASVCGFRVYEVPEGLPALKLPETERMWGNHCERPLTGIWGAAKNAKANIVYDEYVENAYLAAYLGIRNRIAELRYLGQNLAIEGVYMYKQYFPTLSGESQTAKPSFDYCYIMSKMYAHNRIRALAGFEYFSAPSLMLRNGHDIGEREMRASKVPCTPSFSVDRHGRHAMIFGEAGLNWLAPHVWGSMTNLLTEIYRRYEPTGGFEGLFVICNNGWIPGFSSVRNAYTEREVGYDDLSVELFQKETGVSLGIPYTPDRFEKRYQALNGRYAKQWYDWRAKKMRDTFGAFRDICSTGARKWKIYAAPGVEHKQTTSPFTSKTSTVAQRDGYADRIFRESGFPPELYPATDDTGIVLAPRMKFARELDLPLWGVQTSKSAREMYRTTDALYFEPIGLNERWLATETLREWWWIGGQSVVYDMKCSGPAAFYDLVDVCSDHAPKLIVHNWLDVNIPTAHGAESRRFATGFAAMPVGTYYPYSGVTGVQAQRCGDAVILINDTPYEVKGELVSRRFYLPAKVTDAFDGEQSGRFAYTLPGFGITVLRAKDVTKKLTGSFRFSDPAVTALVMKRARALAENTLMQEQISLGVRTRFEDAWARKDVYALAAVLRDYEVRRVADPFFNLILDAPQKPAAELKVVASAKSGPRVYRRGESGGCAPVDPKARDTKRRFTISVLAKTDGRAGDMMVHNTHPFRCDIRTFAGREGLSKDFTGLNASITCFRTKPGQKGWYSVGMEQWDGAKKDVWHHVCMTVDPDSIAAVWVDGNLVDAKELADHHGLAFDPQGEGVGFGGVCPKGMDVAGTQSAWIVRRDGVMDWHDIQKEAAEWLKAAREFK